MDHSPDLVSRRLGQKNLISRCDRQVMRLHTLCYHRFCAILRKSDQPLPVVLAGVQPAIRAKRDAMRAVAAPFPDANLSLKIDLLNPVPSRVGEVVLSVFIPGGIPGIPYARRSLMFSSAETGGLTYLFYPRGQGNDGNLVVTHNQSGSFATQVLATGANANMPGTPALNFSVAGWGVQMASNAKGSFTGVYLGPGNWLYSLSCGD